MLIGARVQRDAVDAARHCVEVEGAVVELERDVELVSNHTQSVGFVAEVLDRQSFAKLTDCHVIWAIGRAYVSRLPAGVRTSGHHAPERGQS